MLEPLELAQVLKARLALSNHPPATPTLNVPGQQSSSTGERPSCRILKPGRPIHQATIMNPVLILQYMQYASCYVCTVRLCRMPSFDSALMNGSQITSHLRIHTNEEECMQETVIHSTDSFRSTRAVSTAHIVYLSKPKHYCPDSMPIVKWLASQTPAMPWYLPLPAHPCTFPK